MDQRLASNGTIVAPVCSSDCYPGYGVWLKNSVKISEEEGGNCAGEVDGTLGGLAPVDDGFWLTIASSADVEGEDIALYHIGNDDVVGPRIWLTNTPGKIESAGHLAVFDGGLLAGWRLDAEYKLARIDLKGAMVGEPVVIPTRLSEHNEFFLHPNGDVGWAFATKGMAKLNLVHVKPCD
jgi:hypothetical protein